MRLEVQRRIVFSKHFHNHLHTIPVSVSGEGREKFFCLNLGPYNYTATFSLTVHSAVYVPVGGPCYLEESCASQTKTELSMT